MSTSCVSWGVKRKNVHEGLKAVPEQSNREVYIHWNCDKKFSIECILICDLASAGLCPHLPTSLYSLYSSHHLSLPERTKPTLSHPRTFALAVFSFSFGYLFKCSLLPPDFLVWLTPQYSGLSLNVILLGPLWCCSLPPFSIIHYYIISFIFFIILIAICNDLGHIFIYLSIVFILLLM